MKFSLVSCGGLLRRDTVECFDLQCPQLLCRPFLFLVDVRRTVARRRTTSRIESRQLQASKTTNSFDSSRV